MDELTAVDKERLYSLVYLKIKDIEKQLADTDYKKLREQLKIIRKQYLQLLEKLE